MRIPLASAVLLVSCAANRPHGNSALHISASHYASMTGVQLQGDMGPVICNRESITGSHILHWYCRFPDDSAQYELGRRIVFDTPLQ